MIRPSLITVLLWSLSAQHLPAETAVFAGGCFWCMEPPYDELEGVTATTSGYTGGEVEDPSYEQVSAGDTGHYEAVRVEYNPDQVDYQTLLDVFWRNIDPFDARGQFCDRGSQYRAAIFYQTPRQERLAKQSKAELQRMTGAEPAIRTEILPAGKFYPAEKYHQDYYEKNPLRYKFYRLACGRERRLEEVREQLEVGA